MKRKSPTPAERKRMASALAQSPTYRKAYQDVDFLGREELRPIRLQLELLKPEMALIEHDIRSTIIVFGSARIPAPEDARRVLEETRAKAKKRPGDKGLQASVDATERLLARSRYYEEARKFSCLVTRESQGAGGLDYVVVTGGGPGIMEAANRGAFEAGGKSIGLNITLPTEQEPNPYITPELCFLFHYFAIRKMHFLMRARAMVAFPGGFGTLDELFETLTLVQTGKKTRMPIVLVGREFWTRVVNFNTMASEGVISQEDMGLVRFVETAEEAWEYIRGYWEKNRCAPPPRRRKSISAPRIEERPVE